MREQFEEGRYTPGVPRDATSRILNRIRPRWQASVKATRELLCLLTTRRYKARVPRAHSILHRISSATKVGVSRLKPDVNCSELLPQEELFPYLGWLFVYDHGDLRTDSIYGWLLCSDMLEAQRRRFGVEKD
jgi:hypothetical protein